MKDENQDRREGLASSAGEIIIYNFTGRTITDLPLLLQSVLRTSYKVRETFEIRLVDTNYKVYRNCSASGGIVIGEDSEATCRVR